MLDAIVRFFTRTFQAIGRGLGLAVAFVLKPFVWLGRWITQRGVILKVLLGIFVLGIVALYGYFFWATQRWTNFDPDYGRAYERKAEAGTPAAPNSKAAGIIASDEDAKTAQPWQRPAGAP